jgi:hypothetical protein
VYVPALAAEGFRYATHATAFSALGNGTATEPPVEIDVSGIERVEGGYTIAEIFENRARLAGQEVAVRGKVVKFNSEILGRNWIHLQDGTVGPGGAKDLVVTSDEVAEVGSTVIVRGTVVTDEDFGYGYAYDVLIHEASVTVE